MRDKVKLPPSESSAAGTTISKSLGSSQERSVMTSDHFDGEKFFNRSGKMSNNFFQAMKFFFGGPTEDWPDYTKDSESPPKNPPAANSAANDRNKISSAVKSNLPQRTAHGEILVTFINHSTVLIQADGLNIMTDPIFSSRASPFAWAGPKRARRPGIELTGLPPIDIVMVSHNHYDHMDEASLKWLAEKNPETVFLVPLGDGHWLKKWKISNHQEMDWGQQKKFGRALDLEVTFEEAQHWSGRWLNDRSSSLWGSFLIKTSKGLIFFGGDTGYGPHFSRISRQYGALELSLLPIGAYEPRDFMKFHHMNPEDAAQAHLDLKSKRSIGIHYGTFKLTYEGINRPIEQLEKAKEKLGIRPGDFVTLGFGQSTTIEKILPE